VGNRKTAAGDCRQRVYQPVKLRHPDKYNGHDICGLAKRNTAEHEIKVAQRKEICFLFGIEIEGPAGGKHSLREATRRSGTSLQLF